MDNRQGKSKFLELVLSDEYISLNFRSPMQVLIDQNFQEIDEALVILDELPEKSSVLHKEDPDQQ